MKIIAYAVRPDEREAFERFSKAFGMKVDLIEEPLNAQTVDLSKGYDAICFFGHCEVNRDVLSAVKSYNITYMASRSAGFNNVDLEAAKDLGIRISNAAYSPNSVADFTVMLILMTIRKMKTMMKRNEAHDYSLPGVQGREMHNLTFGIIGTGRIGATTAMNLSGFGGQILGYDLHQNPALEDIVRYTDLDTLLANSDVITLHAPYMESTHHLIDKNALSKTKPGVILINCARTELIDPDALLHYLEQDHFGGVALDVFPNELGIVHNDMRQETFHNPYLAILSQYKHVIITPHIAFYTDQAVSDMVEIPLRSLVSFINDDESPWEIK